MSVSEAIFEGINEIIANPEDTTRLLAITKATFKASSELLKDAKEHARAEKDPERRRHLTNTAQTFVRSLTTLLQRAKEASLSPHNTQLMAAAEDVKKSLLPLAEALSTS
eukprot:TRINITY_DN13807_c0_g1_i1.p2 TRINITY_DN13807_c0_g1~~TRINITY_DN13807_c0_g1_i1.p2  ORF type:complete len:119 (-),score=39.21 TRINITY_DN13807_c0_g1_i1:46-375(-)